MHASDPHHAAVHTHAFASKQHPASLTCYGARRIKQPFSAAALHINHVWHSSPAMVPDDSNNSPLRVTMRRKRRSAE